MARKLIIILAALFAVICLAIVALAVFRDNSPSRPMPNPNGFDDFVSAGKLVVLSKDDYASLSRNDYTKFSRDELAALVAANSNSLVAVRDGLAHDSLVPDDHVLYAGEFMKLTEVLCAEGQLAELDGRTNDAAQICLEAVRFGEASSRGGIILERELGIARETVALNQLGSLSDKLDATNSRAMAQGLEAIDVHEDTAQQTLQEERHWTRKTGGLRGQITLLLNYKRLQQTRDAFINKDENLMRLRRRMMLSFAAHAYQVDKGKLPATAADLVPDYVKAVPQDPTTGQDLSLGP